MTSWLKLLKKRLSNPKKKQSSEPPAEWSPLGNLRREFDRMLEDFPWGWRRPLARSPFDVEPFWRGFAGLGAVPAVDIAEKEKEYRRSS